MNSSLKYAQDNKVNFLEELKDFLRIPSVSADSAYSENVYDCAKWLKNHIKKIGLKSSEIIETDGHPIVFAENNIESNKPTVLIYGHYDVQPPDPISEWRFDPFEPEIIDDHIYARGACDDKGNVFAILKAIESVLKTNGLLKYNIKLLLEGEEETGSVNLIETIKRHPQKFSADIILICDTAMLSEDSPVICLSARGIVYTELILEGFNQDLHSGVYGGAVENPIHILAKLIAGFHDENHRVTVNGFYDNVAELNPAERKELNKVPFDDSQFLSKIGLSGGKTEKGYSVYEGRTIRPTLDVNGIWGGYTGDGVKTIIPSKVGAKISCRLVANQDPKRIYELLKNHIKENLPESVKITFKQIAVADPVTADYQHPAFKSFATALDKTFNTKTHYIRGDGTLPILTEFKNRISPNIILSGFGLDSDSVHSPNERFGLKRFEKGIEALIRFFTKETKM